MRYRLWEVGTTFFPEEEEKVDIANFLIDELTQFLGHEIETFQEHLVSDGSFTIAIRNRNLFGGPFAIQWEALLVFTARKSGPPYIQAFFSLFSDLQRIQLLEKGVARRVFVLTYIQRGKAGEWVKEGWTFEDEFDFETTLKKPNSNLYSMKHRTYG